eukprot:7042763-Lingulodinium_polyedra.AAC.1
MLAHCFRDSQLLGTLGPGACVTVNVTALIALGATGSEPSPDGANKLRRFGLSSSAGVCLGDVNNR